MLGNPTAAFERTKIVALVLLVVAMMTGVASAHPLGNFTVNRYARLEPGLDALVVVYVVDFAEIPTFQELARFPRLTPANGVEALGREADAEGLARQLGARWTAGLQVVLGDTPLALTERSRSLVFVDGVGGLPTMTLRLRLAAPWPRDGAGAVAYEDRNEPARLGWREIVVRPTTEIVVADLSAPFVDRSHELGQYPTAPDAEFPQEIRARWRVAGVRAGAVSEPATSSSDSPALAAGDSQGAATRGPRSLADDRFVRLIMADHLTPELIFASLVIAFALGGFHALSPGHGKTIVAAYLVGARGTARHALILSAIVTASHTIGVFALGLVTLALSARVVPERLYPWMQLVSGAMIVVIGLTMAIRRLRSSSGLHAHGDHGHHGEHDHHHDHDHGDHDHGGHGHVHVMPEGEPTMANLLALGISGGVLPCPSALVVLLSAIALHRVGFGLVLIVAFSLGLASVLCGVGILVVRAGAMLEGFESASGLARRLPALSALLVTVLGALLVAGAMAEFRSPSSGPMGPTSRLPSVTARP